MRESTRRLYAEKAAVFIDSYVPDLFATGRCFNALEVQTYLMAELGRPCLSDRHSPAHSSTFCCIWSLKGPGTDGRPIPRKIEHNVDGSKAPQPRPLVVYDSHWRLYPGGANGGFLRPFRHNADALPAFYRRNCFVVRNLNVSDATVTVSSPGHNRLLLGHIDGSGGSREIEFENSTATTLPGRGGSMVVVCNRKFNFYRLLPDAPVMFASSVGRVLVFHLAELIP